MDEMHSERGVDNGLEPTVGEHMRLAQFLKALDKANEAELREIARKMAEQVMVVFPSALRYLAREAAKNLAGQAWSKESSDRLLEALEAPHR
jgi:thymidylate synthase ThyX